MFGHVLKNYEENPDEINVIFEGAYHQNTQEKMFKNEGIPDSEIINLFPVFVNDGGDSDTNFFQLENSNHYMYSAPALDDKSKILEDPYLRKGI